MGTDRACKRREHFDTVGNAWPLVLIKRSAMFNKHGALVLLLRGTWRLGIMIGSVGMPRLFDALVVRCFTPRPGYRAMLIGRLRKLNQLCSHYALPCRLYRGVLWCHAVFAGTGRCHAVFSRLRAGRVGEKRGFFMQNADCQESKPHGDGVQAASNFGISMIILLNASLIAASARGYC